MRQKLVVGNCQNILGYFVKSHSTSDLGIMLVSCCFTLEPHCLWSDSMYQALFAKDTTSANEIGSWPCHHHLFKRNGKKKMGDKNGIGLKLSIMPHVVFANNSTCTHSSPNMCTRLSCINVYSSCAHSCFGIIFVWVTLILMYIHNTAADVRQPILFYIENPPA